MDHITKDKRFAHIVKDPRFHKIPRKERKIKIDNRFKDMFTDEKFKLKCSVDKRGRTLKLSTNENLKRFYDISDESSSGSETDSSNDTSDDDQDSKKLHGKVDRISKGEENESSDSEDLDEPDNEKHEKTRKNGKVGEESESLDSEELDESDSDQYEVPTRKGDGKKGKKKKSDLKDQRSEKKTVKFSQGMKLKKTVDKSMKGEKKETSDSDEFDESDDEHKEPIKQGKVRKREKENSEIKDNISKKEMVKTSTKMGQNESLEKSDLNADVKKKQKYRRKKGKKSKKKKGKKVENDSDSDSSVDKMELLTKGEIDFARGEAELSSTSEEDEDDNETDEDDGLVHNWADLDGNVEEVQEATPRLAICNLDWDRITSKDIFTVLNSFKPNNGFIRSVKIYMSEYGKERIEQEKAEGPKELKAIQYEDEDDETLMEDKTVKDSFTESLRQYQFNRLRYYYGVVDCDSVGTADHLYKECDGNEYETSCTKFDLRFIPEEMEFDDSDMRSECGDIPHGYQPDYFKNYAMAFSKAELTWDETDRKRQQLVTQKFTESVDDLKDDDLKAYLAESSDEEEVDYSKLIGQSDSGSESDERESEDKHIDKYKKLLQDLDTEEKEKEKGDVQMEITWEMGLKETTEELVKKKSQSSDKTVWEKYLDRKKEKKKEKRKDKKKKKDEEESDVEAGDQQDGSFEAFSDDDVPEDIKDDPFFAEELNQTNSTKKKEKGNKKKKKKGKEVNTEEDENEKAALSLLMMDEDDNKKHFNLKKIIEEDGQEGKKKKKKKKNKKTEDVKKDEDNFELNVKDPRFSAIYESNLYNIDPSAPEYKKTKGSEALVTEKLKRNTDPDSRKRAIQDKSHDSMKRMRLENTDNSKNESLASLVKSVKAKTKSFQNAKSFKDR